MKLIKGLKNNSFSLKSLFTHHKKEEKNHSHEIENGSFTNDDKLFYILNIGNHEYTKNRSYFIDEIEFRIEEKQSPSEIAHFIHDFIKTTYDIKIKDFSLEKWIKTTYKQKLEIQKKKH